MGLMLKRISPSPKTWLQPDVVLSPFLFFEKEKKKSVDKIPMLINFPFYLVNEKNGVTTMRTTRLKSIRAIKKQVPSPPIKHCPERHSLVPVPRPPPLPKY